MLKIPAVAAAFAKFGVDVELLLAMASIAEVVAVSLQDDLFA